MIITAERPASFRPYRFATGEHVQLRILPDEVGVVIASNGCVVEVEFPEGVVPVAVGDLMHAID